MAVFGAPVAHEDDAERAVRAALSMQRAVRRVLDDERGGGAPLGLRVGLNTGEVVAGVQAAHRVHGHRRHGEHRGPAGRRRRRRRGLRRRAAPPRRPGTWPPGGSCARCGSRASASRSRRTSCSACWTRRAPGPAWATRRPFVGREAELGRVASRLAEVVDRGEPRVLVFTAEAGLGKTRFAAEVERLAAGYDAVGRYAARRRPGAVGALRRLRRAAPAGARWPTWSGSAIGLPDRRRRPRPPGRSSRSGCAGSARRLGAGPAPRRRLADRAAAGPARATREPPGDAAPTGAAGDGWRAAERRRRPDAGGGPGRGRRAAQRRWPREAPLVVDRGRPARRHPGDRGRARRHAVPARPGRCWCCCSAGRSWCAPAGRADPARRRRGAPAAAAARRRRGPAAHRLPRRRPAAAGRRGPAARHRPGQPVLPGRAGHPADRAGRADPSTGGAADRRAGGWRPARSAAGCSPGTSPRCSPPGSTRCRRTPARCCATPPWSATRCRPARWRRCASGAAGRDGRPAAVVAVELERAVEELLHRRMLRRTRGGYAFATPLMREAAYAGVGKADLAERHARLARLGGRAADAGRRRSPPPGWARRRPRRGRVRGRAGRAGRRAGRRGGPAPGRAGPDGRAAGRGRAGPARPAGARRR